MKIIDTLEIKSKFHELKNIEYRLEVEDSNSIQFGQRNYGDLIYMISELKNDYELTVLRYDYIRNKYYHLESYISAHKQLCRSWLITITNRLKSREKVQLIFR